MKEAKVVIGANFGDEGKGLKCDRCGTLYERECTPDVRINIYIHPYGDEWVDLCPKCQEMLENFISICWQEKARNKTMITIKDLSKKEI